MCCCRRLVTEQGTRLVTTGSKCTTILSRDIPNTPIEERPYSLFWQDISRGNLSPNKRSCMLFASTCYGCSSSLLRHFRLTWRHPGIPSRLLPVASPDSLAGPRMFLRSNLAHVIQGVSVRGRLRGCKCDHSTAEPAERRETDATLHVVMELSESRVAPLRLIEVKGLLLLYLYI